MRIIARIAAKVEALLGVWAEECNRECTVVQRERKFTAATLAQTLGFGFLAKPEASDKELAEMAGACGVEVSPQAIEQRFTPRLVQFAELLFRRAMSSVIEASPALAPLLGRFHSVLVLDSTTISLPDELRDRFPGCGGSHGSGQAALKLQVQWDLGGGTFQACSIEPGRACDYKTPLQSAPLPAGSLRITDLGYFDTERLEAFSQQGVFWLSRLQFGTRVFTEEGAPLSLLKWLNQQSGPVVDVPVRIGTQRKVACRLIACRVPEEVANRRRQKLIAEARRKRGRTPTQERLAWCDWTILVTNVPPERLSPQEALVLYRARWQIELVFKRWKSLGRVVDLTGSPTRQMAQLWWRLLAVVLQQWLVLTGPWGDARLSLTKASQLIRRYAFLLAMTLKQPDQLHQVLHTLSRAIHKTARINKRKRPHTFELLHNPTLLEPLLT